MYYIELETGLRRGELLGLKWHDIDWKNRIIKAMRSIALLNGVDIKTVSGMLGHFPQASPSTPTPMSQPPPKKKPLKRWAMY